MITMKANQVKTHLAEVLRKVEQGQEIAITKHNRTIARLTPWNENSKETKNAAVKALLQLKKIPLKAGESIESMRDEGRS